MRVTYSERGFGRVEFKDDHAAACKIVESSADGRSGQPRLWLMTEGGAIEGNDGSMLLTQAQAKRMIPHLQKFIRTGHL